MAASDVSSVTAAGQVEIEAVAWISKFVGGDDSTRKSYHEPLQDGDTVRTVLRRLSGRFPQCTKRSGILRLEISPSTSQYW